MNHPHRRANWSVFEKTLSRAARHPDAAMRGRIPREVACMDSHRSMDSHEKRHWRPAKPRTRRAFVAAKRDIRLHDIPLPVHKIAVEIRSVVFVFLSDFETTRRRAETLPACRNRGFADRLISFKKGRGL
jgi:hypothetical protein